MAFTETGGSGKSWTLTSAVRSHISVEAREPKYLGEGLAGLSRLCESLSDAVRLGNLDVEIRTDGGDKKNYFVGVTVASRDFLLPLSSGSGGLDLNISMAFNEGNRAYLGNRYFKSFGKWSPASGATTNGS